MFFVVVMLLCLCEVFSIRTGVIKGGIVGWESILVEVLLRFYAFVMLYRKAAKMTYPAFITMFHLGVYGMSLL